MPIEMSLSCSCGAISPSIQFGFKTSLPRGEGRYTHSSTHAHTSPLSSSIRLEWSMALPCIQGRIRTEFCHPVPPVSCCLLHQEEEKNWFNSLEDKTIGGLCEGSVGEFLPWVVLTPSMVVLGVWEVEKWTVWGTVTEQLHCEIDINWNWLFNLGHMGH